jgi:hypothetical protein
MTTPCLQHGGDTAPDTYTDKAGAFAGQVSMYLRAYQRILRRRPTDLQRRLMQTAATAAARYDAAVCDPTLSGQTLAHLERVSRKSLAAMHASFPKPQPERNRLMDYLSGRYGDDDDTTS